MEHKTDCILLLHVQIQKIQYFTGMNKDKIWIVKNNIQVLLRK